MAGLFNHFQTFLQQRYILFSSLPITLLMCPLNRGTMLKRLSNRQQPWRGGYHGFDGTRGKLTA